MKISPIQPFTYGPPCPIAPSPNTQEFPWANSWAERYGKRLDNWPFLDPWASPSDVQSAHPYILDAGRTVFDVPVATATENQLFTASFIGDPGNLRTDACNYRLWQYQQQLPAVTYTTESIQDGLDFAQHMYDQAFQSERQNQYAQALTQRVVSGGGGFVDRGPLINVSNITGEVGRRSELNKITRQYINGGMDPRIVLANAISTRDGWIRRGVNQKLINSINIEIGQMVVDLKHNPVYEW